MYMDNQIQRGRHGDTRKESIGLAYGRFKTLAERAHKVTTGVA